MPRQKQTKGTCAFCASEIGKGTVARHLEKCAPFQDALEKAASRGKAAPQTIYHLRVSDAYDNHFWLDLEMNGAATLKKLDTYLRAIWLECCGHLSEFSAGGWGGTKFGMARKANDVWDKTDELTHIYDFGTSSQTTIKIVSARVGQPLSKHPIALLVRNVMPAAQCRECEQLATHLCMGCVIENDEPGLLCEQHLKIDPHGDDYGEPIELVNSPRLGMCGYDGPAEPPY